jgi:hypothetical protein
MYIPGEFLILEPQHFVIIAKNLSGVWSTRALNVPVKKKISVIFFELNPKIACNYICHKKCGDSVDKNVPCRKIKEDSENILWDSFHNLEDLARVMKAPAIGVSQKSRQKLLTVYENTFSGAEAVTWIILQNIPGIETRDHAVWIAQKLIEHRLGNFKEISDNLDQIYRKCSTKNKRNSRQHE